MTDKAKLEAFFKKAADILELCEETQAAHYFRVMQQYAMNMDPDEDLPLDDTNVGIALGV